jgi:hypothetical protein
MFSTKIGVNNGVTLAKIKKKFHFGEKFKKMKIFRSKKKEIS